MFESNLIKVGNVLFVIGAVFAFLVGRKAGIFGGYLVFKVGYCLLAVVAVFLIGNMILRKIEEVQYWRAMRSLSYFDKFHKRKGDDYLMPLCMVIPGLMSMDEGRIVIRWEEDRHDEHVLQCSRANDENECFLQLQSLLGEDVSWCDFETQFIPHKEADKNTLIVSCRDSRGGQ